MAVDPAPLRVYLFHIWEMRLSCPSGPMFRVVSHCEARINLEATSTKLFNQRVMRRGNRGLSLISKLPSESLLLPKPILGVAELRNIAFGTGVAQGDANNIGSFG